MEPPPPGSADWRGPPATHSAPFGILSTCTELPPAELAAILGPG
jgi:hypothetical protein